MNMRESICDDDFEFDENDDEGGKNLLSSDAFKKAKMKMTRKNGIERKDSIGSLASSCDEFDQHTSKSASLQDLGTRRAKSKGNTILQEINRQHGKGQRASLYLFDDRVFIADDRVDAERLLKINATSNPVAKRLNPIMAAGMKILGIGLSSFRAVYNMLMWKDPNLSYCVVMLLFCLMIVILIFPWRPFFFISGIAGLGPQNKFLVPWYSDRKEKQRQEKRASFTSLQSSPRLPQDAAKGGVRFQEEAQESEESGHHKDLSNCPLLIRNNVHLKPDGKNRQVIVPSAPFRHNRFYDWPPDPASSTVKCRMRKSSRAYPNSL